MEPYEIPRGAVVVDGKVWPCATEVKNWERTSLQFKPPHGARWRKEPADLIVLHFTAGEETPEGLYRVLQERGLGIEFSIIDGVIYQHCDPTKVDTFDAGSVNRRSIGIEIRNCGVAPLPKKAADRGTYEATVNGHKFTFAKFYGPDLKAMADLCDTLTEAGRIPRVYPTKPALLTPEGLARFKGVLGHFHVSSIKIDPGLQPFEYLKARGYTGKDDVQ